ncbi:RsmB/NOP family class I SAM-dependent RNA methyltransferase [Desulfovibrio ferrophilus]|uniref:tRNA/rRNA cytosine-C5-methylase n=1 Tax=Desulfovibrio ferrophilus TaxID=241368 RepID=A0A2Z6B1M6_9BACT|nr:transcription antitermination factor NusB [Desulfovibrio ferrophilus]BBD09375.1 tRNA/rRNA cytosine-C5-methylase [Desulfovibrio ferrophilus]
MSRRPNFHNALPPARRAALDALTACLKGADIQAALDSALTPKRGQEPLVGRDAALATELAYGTLRLKLRLDFLLAHYLTRPDGLPVLMRMALSLAAYEITQLDKVPAYASVDWCVEHIKASINPGLANVANAVLRKIVDLGDSASDPEFYRTGTPNQRAFMAHYYATPRWLTDLWCDSYGDQDTEHYLAATTKAAPLGLRFRPGVPETAKLLEQWTFSDHCLDATPSGIALNRTPEDFHELLESGGVLRQSLAGQQAMLALGCDNWPRPLWDACCGRGGKTLLLADAGGGPILASDPSMARLRGLKRELQRLDVPGVIAARVRADRPAPLNEPVPAILVDAPCSGLGVLSRRPDAKLKRQPNDLIKLAALQDKILDNAALHLAPGGILAYVTCTLNPAENEQRVQEFMSRHSEFGLDMQWQTPPDSPLNEFFYAARLTRTG